MTPSNKTNGEGPSASDLETHLGPEIDEALLALDELAVDDPEEALATFDTLPEPVQALVDFQLLAARAHQALNQLEAARDLLLALLTEHGENPDVHHQLGDVLEDLGDEGRANEHFAKVLDLDRAAFDELPDDAKRLASDDVRKAFAALAQIVSVRSLVPKLEPLPSKTAVASGLDPRALSRIVGSEKTWTAFVGNLAFEYGDIEDDQERVQAVMEGLLDSVSEQLALSQGELTDLGLSET